MAKFQTLKDEMKGTAIQPVWTLFTASGGALTFSTNGYIYSLGDPAQAGGDCDTSSVSTYSLIDSYACINIYSLTNPIPAFCFAIFRLQATSANMVWFEINGSNLKAKKTVASAETTLATVTYDPVAHSWLRIMENNRITYWQASDNGVSWVTIWSEANPITMTALNMLIGYISTGTDSAPGSFTVRNANVLPSGKEFSGVKLRPRPFLAGLAR